jgi:hypothetical protein
MTRRKRSLIVLRLLRRKRVYLWPRLPQHGFSAKMVSHLRNYLTLAVSAPIVGLNSEERIKEMVEAVNLELTSEEIKELEEPYQPTKIVGFS